MLLINCPDGKEISIYFIRVWRGCGSLLKANFSIKYAFAKKGTQSISKQTVRCNNDSMILSV